MKNKNQLISIVFFLFTIPSLFATAGSFFCGGGYNPEAYYFNLFNQENISQKAFYPFLRIEDSPFHSGVASYQSENIRLWYHYFDKKYKKKTLANIILEGNKNGFSENFKKGKKEAQFIKYLDFAKNCQAIAIKKRTSWDYNEILKTKEVNVSDLLEDGLSLFENEDDADLKIRYAYQIIRLHHYGKMNAEAITFFEDNIKNVLPKNEIYYYALDQLGGCYYNLKQYEKAAYIFLTVFDKSFDKKKSAFTSYKFCTYRGAEGKTLLTTKEEEANQIFITGLRQFSDELQDIARIRDLGAAEDKQELLMMRLINNIERSSLRHYIPDEKSIMDFDNETKEKIEDILYFIEDVLKDNPNNKAFWQLTSSYLSFLSGNISLAKTKLTGISSSKLNQQKESLAVIYEVFSWDNISYENELWLANVFKGFKNINVVDLEDCNNDTKNKYNCHLHEFTFKQLSHYYFKEDKLAKAFLMHNYLGDIAGISSHKLVDQLIDFVDKPNKNPFEKLLLKERFDRGISKATSIQSLKKEKGEIYFRSGDYNNAIHFLDKNESKDISPSVFSNNIKECFSCEAAEVMEDEVYKAEFFSFLNKDLNKFNIAKSLKKLELIVENEEEKLWKRKLANYLLANYFFNVSNTGYYRTINYSGSYWYNYSFGRGRVTMDEIITTKNNFYFKTIYNDYNDLASKSKEYYRSTIELSNDEELNARCSYMIAKCELNDFYNNRWERNYYGYDGEVTEKPTREGFEALKTSYRQTQFYKEIKSKCGFFKHYDAQ